MITAWMFLISLSLLLARFYKPAFPEKKICGVAIWFAVSCASMSFQNELCSKTPLNSFHCDTVNALWSNLNYKPALPEKKICGVAIWFAVSSCILKFVYRERSSVPN